MPATHFSFKQFDIHQDRCAMKVGTDSVLLGAWATIPSAGNILDIGTGTGLLSLMAAQRTHTALITGIEIDTQAAAQARENVARSPWCDRINILQGDFTACYHNLTPPYDCIISNPPYFKQSLLSPDEARSTARHTTALTYDDIFRISRTLITPQGVLSLVIPTDLYDHVNGTAMVYGWGVSRTCTISNTPQHKPKRTLCEWRLNHYTPCVCQSLAIRDTCNVYTREYMELTSDFYLHF